MEEDESLNTIMSRLSELENALEKEKKNEDKIEFLFRKYLDSSISISEKEELRASSGDGVTLHIDKQKSDAEYIHGLIENYGTGSKDDYQKYLELKMGYKKFMEQSFVAKYSRLSSLVRKRMEHIIDDNIETFFKLKLVENHSGETLSASKIARISIDFLSELVGTNTETFEKAYGQELALEVRSGIRPPYDIYKVKSQMFKLSESSDLIQNALPSKKGVLDELWEFTLNQFKGLAESYSQLYMMAEDGDLDRLRILIDEIDTSLDSYEVNYQLSKSMNRMTDSIVTLTIMMVLLSLFMIALSTPSFIVDIKNLPTPADYNLELNT